MVRARRLCTALGSPLAAIVLSACAGSVDSPPRDDSDDRFIPVDREPTDEGAARIESSFAPDEYTVEIQLAGTFSDLALTSPETFVIESSRGRRLEVVAAEYEPVTGVVTLETERQKLGVTYDLTFATDGALQALSAHFPSADTARLWANNFGAENFPSYEVIAERVAVGEHCVVYVEQGIAVDGIEEGVRTFDERIFPIETGLFGDAPDQDDNGKILLFGLNGGAYYGGYFFTGNMLTEEEAMSEWGYHSNEMDMLYVNVATGDFDADVIVAHEFAHLLYAERHGALTPSHAYHDEGLAECAVHAVHGEHPWALPHFMDDPLGKIGAGISLLDWGWGDYDYYAKAYVFWSYLAAQLGGVEAYGTLFELDGHPDTLAAFAQAELGVDFATLQLDVLVATWLREPTGRYGFRDLLSFPPGQPPAAPLETTTLELGPTAGTYLLFPGQSSVDYSGDEGANIRYAGIDWTGKVDLEAPFDIDGGALVVLNASADANQPGVTEPSGPVVPTEGAPAAMPLQSAYGAADRAWLHPPPLVPGRLDGIQQWRNRSLRAEARPSAAVP